MSAQIDSTAYLSPATIDEAAQILADWDGTARVIAGGTDLMLELKKGKIQPGCLVSTDRIGGLDEISIEPGFVVVGAAVTFATLKDHPYLNRYFHALTEAARSVGTLSVQNLATLAGNLVNAMPAADGTVAAIALEAEVHVVDTKHAAWIPVESLFLGPGQSRIDPTRQLLTHIRFPRCESRRGTAWARLGRRPSLTLPILNCAVSVFLDEPGLVIQKARIVLGPVAPVPFRACQAEQFLAGRPISAETLEQAARIAQSETNPRGNILRASREYRLTAIPVMVEESLAIAIQRAS